jgi:hypothetical protein
MALCTICGEDFDRVVKCSECGERFCEDCGDHEKKLCYYCDEEDVYSEEEIEYDDEDWY